MISRSSRGLFCTGDGGFTLIELMVVIAVIAITLGVGMPAFNDFKLNAWLKSYANSLALHTQLARSEAIKRNKPVSLCMSANGTSCTNSGVWGQGWIVIDETSDEVIAYHQAVHANFHVEEASDSTKVTFSARGLKSPAGLSEFRVCRSSEVASHEREVEVSSTGRTTVARVSAQATCP